MANNRQYTFSKEERLSWKRHIDLLFAEGKSFVAFPLRVVYVPLEKGEKETPVAILVSVPKKKIKRAVGRNLIKRRVREAYRLQKHILTDTLTANQTSMFIGFLYMDKAIHPFATIEKAMIKALETLSSRS